MSSEDIPAELIAKPGSAPVPVTISVETEKSMDPERMAIACRELGLFHVTPGMLSAHVLLGEQIEKVGAIKLAQSGSFMGQQILINALCGLSNDMAKSDKPDQVDLRRTIAHEMGYVSGKLAMLNKGLVESSPAAVKDLNAAAPQRSFVPLSKLPAPMFQQNNQININADNPGPTSG